MTYVITQACCNDASCVAVCPVDCIHPTPGEVGFANTEMLYIDPETCIDCGACVEECPVDAIRVDEELSPTGTPGISISTPAITYSTRRDSTWRRPRRRRLSRGTRKLSGWQSSGRDLPPATPLRNC
jgi:NAD-dependent dihydropyrimidine dehydrogenase PreA subunit